MSPTSYQTAPPRVEVAYYTPFAGTVKRYLDFSLDVLPGRLEVAWAGQHAGSTSLPAKKEGFTPYNLVVQFRSANYLIGKAFLMNLITCEKSIWLGEPEEKS